MKLATEARRTQSRKQKQFFCSSLWSPCLCGKTFFSAFSSALSASRRSYVLLICLLAFAGCASSGTKSQSKTADGDVVTTFDDAEHGLRLTYPGDWEEVNTLLKPSGAILLLAPPAHDQEAKFPAVFAVVAPRSDQTVSPEELPAMQQRTIDKAQKEFGDFKLVNASTASVGGEPARRIIYTGTKLGQSLEVMYVLTVHANKPFAFSLMSGPDEFTTQRTEAEKVVESAQWAK